MPPLIEMIVMYSGPLWFSSLFHCLDTAQCAPTPSTDQLIHCHPYMPPLIEMIVIVGPADLVQHFAYRRSSHRRKGAASHVLDMVWLSPIPVWRRGVFYLFKWFLPAFAAPIEEGWEGGRVCTLWPMSVTQNTECQAFYLVVRIGSPTPYPQERVAPPSLGPRWETHSFVGERVGGPNSDDGTDTA